MNIELANGAEGYIPPPEQHALGGYTTWPARSAGLEVEAEPKILSTLSKLLSQLSPQPKPTRSPIGSMDDLETNPDFTIEGKHAFAVPGKTGQALYLANANLTLNKPLKIYKLSFWIWPVETRQWAQVTIEQTKTTRRTYTNNQLTSETAPTPTSKAQSMNWRSKTKHPASLQLGKLVLVVTLPDLTHQHCRQRPTLLTFPHLLNVSTLSKSDSPPPKSSLLAQKLQSSVPGFLVTRSSRQ